jgi:copper resistance protein B
VLLDRLEWAPQRGRDGYAWDFSLLYAGDTHGLWLSSVGEGGLWGSPDYLEFQALYARSFEQDLSLNAGLRWDARPAPQRFYAVAGGQWEPGFGGHDLWVGAFGYLSHKGEFSARLGGIYNHKVSCKLYAQPSFELNALAEDVPELGLGRGLAYAEAGLRVRYEISPKFAPYLGVSWERSLGRTARFARDAGEDVEAKSVVIGVRSSWEPR